MCLNQFLNVLGEKVLTKEGKKYGFGYFEKHNVPCKKLQLILSGHFLNCYFSFQHLVTLPIAYFSWVVTTSLVNPIKHFMLIYYASRVVKSAIFWTVRL